jgi:eukaryotic-like serine/threonine-protein kinase
VNGLVGRRLGRYEIVSLLGAGGMGEVYRARDTQLGRQVAVKVLGAKAFEDPSHLERFEKEARAVALLSHPNILDIHDFGVDGEVVYAVTELLEGKNLRERMGGTSLPLSKALEIGREVAEGLAAAHGKGIVHRDIKPENIFITSTGQVKILDFGIARLKGKPLPDPLDAGTPTATSTVTGPVMGTVGYMSPEQVRGLPAEARSDIFSLGCVLYEMVTGQRAFRAETADDTMLAILHRDPPPMTAARPDVPPALALVVGRCLEKQPEERFESARDVAFALQAVSLTRETVVVEPPIQKRRGSRAVRIGAIGLAAVIVAALVVVAVGRGIFGAATLPKERRVAVTRFADAADDPGLQAFGAGLTRILADNLVLLEEQTHGALWVLPNPSSGPRDTTRLRNLGRQWGATLILAARVEKASPRVRLTLALVEPASGRALRSAEIGDQPGNIAVLQVEPVLEAAKMLGVDVSPETRTLLTARTTNVTAAFAAYVTGVGLLQGEPKDPDLDRAVAQLRSAVSADPVFAPARIALAQACLRKLERTRDTKWLDAGVQEAEQAGRGGPQACKAYAVMADLYRAAGRKPEVVSSLQRAVALCPDGAEGHMALGQAYQAAGKTKEAEAALQRAIYLRPGYWPGYHWLARLYLSQGAYESAATEFRHVIESAPGNQQGYNNLGYVYRRLDRRQESQEMFERSLAIEPKDNPFAFLNLGTLYFEDARFADAAALFEKALTLRSDDYLMWGNLAYAYKFGLTPAKAAESFRRAIELAEKQRLKTPDDPALLCRLADYYAATGERAKGMETLAAAIAAKPVEPPTMASVAAAYEDLGERERALEWVGRAFDKGVQRNEFENQPALRALIADERYRKLVDARKKTQ